MMPFCFMTVTASCLLISFAAMRILMVCLGNICRSPMAEGILRHKVKERGLDWVVDSAGTESYHVGEAPHKFSQNICKVHGIDISGQRARKFVAADFAKYDKIYAMAADVYDEIDGIGGRHADMSKVDYFLNELPDNTTKNASVPDPYYGGESGFTEVYEMIDKICDAIIARFKKDNYV
jgi:protein-tyrosine phosphatase